LEFAHPGMTRAQSLKTLSIMDKWRQAVGVEFSVEKPVARTRTISGRILSQKRNTVKSINLSGLQKPISNIALGIMGYSTFPAAAIALDAFFEDGGKLIDTAFDYGDGLQDNLLGEWMSSRSIREEIVVMEKGAQTPLCYPDVIGKQLQVSLERLKTDYVDIYLMHRDNIDIPVGEFVDALDEAYRAGKIRGPVGFSNWNMERFDEAIEYACRNNRIVPSVLSNNFSLAEMIIPAWDGCLSCFGDRWKEWLIKNKVTNFAWSSLARGFFTDKITGHSPVETDVPHAWYSKNNSERKNRAISMAQEYGKSVTQVALAYIIAQQSDIIPILGPRSLSELHHSLGAAGISLSARDLLWLETGKE
jgi:aryl-alcohol dehydrogenase-like predicted oxidoreductase